MSYTPYPQFNHATQRPPQPYPQYGAYTPQYAQPHQGFSSGPPPVPQIPQPTPRSNPPATTPQVQYPPRMSSTQSSSSDLTKVERSKSLSGITIPTEKLEELTLEELKDLNSDETAFIIFFTTLEDSLSDLRRITKGREEAVKENKSMASETLAQEPVLKEKKEKLTHCCLEVQTLQNRYQQQYTKMVDLLNKFESSEMKRDLKKGAEDSEAKGEELVDEYLAKRVPVDDFMSQYTEERTKYLLRKVKLEKLEELTKKQGSGLTQTSPGYPVPAPRTYRAPYPVGGASHPHPSQRY